MPPLVAKIGTPLHYTIYYTLKIIKVNTGMNISLNIHHFYSGSGIYFSDKVNISPKEKKLKRRICILLAGIICLGLNILSIGSPDNGAADDDAINAYLDVSASVEHDDKNIISAEGNIKYIDFTPTAAAMRAASDYDIKTHGSDRHISWIDLLAAWAAKNGGSFDSFSEKKLAALAERILSVGTAQACGNEKLFNYYSEAYGAVLGGMLGEYAAVSRGEDGSENTECLYGIRAFSPIAAGWQYTDYDDFGASRSFGYRRRHLGHDMLGSVGTPVIAMEGGYVECCGWNVYGGWRIGIRSFDGKRYYYYAHLRRGHPYCDIYEGKIVDAGEVIGYLGMTGYSTKEDKNNIDTPHLHVGLEIIFKPEQKDGYNQIWVDMYSITSFLSDKRAATFHDAAANERVSRIHYIYPETPD